MDKPKLEIKTLKQLIDEYEDAEAYDIKNYENLLQNKYIHKVDLLKRVSWLKSQITLNDVNNRNVINAINEAFSELFEVE
jgi:hypothetical protein